MLNSIVPNEPELFRLVYYSQNRIMGSSSDVEREIEQILAVSRNNNAKANVTGALIFNSGVFAQILEGSSECIEAIFERIQRDKRHGDVHVLSFEEVAERAFPSWSMAHVGRSYPDQELFKSVGERTGFDNKRLDHDRIFVRLLWRRRESWQLPPECSRNCGSTARYLTALGTGADIRFI
jgi:hypothetical protein